MQSVLFLAVAAVVCGSLALACETPWQDCGSTDIKINNVVVENCCAAPCKVVLGQDTIFSFTFTPDKTYEDLNQSVCGLLESECVKFPNEDFTDMCKCSDCTLSKPCPFEANTMYNISVKVPLSSSFPEIRTVAKWTIYDKDPSTTIGCFEVPVQTVRSKTD